MMWNLHRTFHVMKAGCMESSRSPGTYVYGYWCEEQETSDHGFLEFDPDNQGNYTFQVWNDCEDYAWKVRRYRRRIARKGPIRSPNARKGKGKGRKRWRPPMYPPKGRGKGGKSHYESSQPPLHTDLSVHHPETIHI